jgi:LysR family hydrogen peroxide-inducible transcriptional activator
MTLTELKYIVAVAHHKHFGRAAQACFVSQPTLSAGIKKLEEQLDVQIFERSNHEVMVTHIGQAIIAQADQVLMQVNEIKALAKQGKNPLIGSLKLGVIYTIGPYLLPRLVESVLREYPEMPLILQENYTHELVAQLKQNELDAIIIASALNDASLVSMPLYDEDFVVAVPRQHALAESSSVSVEHLQQHTMLLLGAGHCFRDQILDVCPQQQQFNLQGHVPGDRAVVFQQTFAGSSLETIRQMVSFGLGITILPKMAVPAQERTAIQQNETPIRYLPFSAPIPQRQVVLVARKRFGRMTALTALASLIHTLTHPSF